MSSIIIAPMSENHIESVAELEAQCFTSPWSHYAFLSELSNSYAYYIVAEQNGIILGFAGIHIIYDEGYITNIAVAQSHRRKGIAEALLNAIEKHAIAKGVALITLEVRETNFGAIKLYQNHFFKEVGIRKDFYTLPIENAILMTKTIKQ
jgi:ribosomal-protein-alanine N-acetyltransferase